MKKLDWRKWASVARDYLLITVGALVIAAGTDMFLVPNRVVSTGVTGLGMLAHYLFHTPVGLVTLLLNVPLFIAGLRWAGGWSFGLRTVYAVAVMAAGIDLLAGILPQVTEDALIYTLFGGLLDGVGIGLVLRGRGTTGGSDIIARLLHRWRGVAYGQALLVINGLILLASLPVVGLTPVLYALVVNFVSSRVVDVVLEGPSYARAVTIVSARPDVIRSALLAQLDRGVTVLEGKGGYTGAPYEVLLCVVARSELNQLKQIIAAADPQAFVIVTETQEVLGQGFRPVKTVES
jgi:uncharacterized membrane-anchored protein YitT (DUF2179 family)